MMTQKSMAEEGFSLNATPLSRAEDQRAKKAARWRAWYQANKERQKALRQDPQRQVKQQAYENARSQDPQRKAKRAAQKKEWHKANREHILARCKAWREANKKVRKDTYLKYTYGLSLQAFHAMLVTQRNRCKCCKTLFGNTREAGPYVDHCHATDKVRGLLCFHCNTTLGLANDDPKVLRACARYLERMAKEVQVDPCNPPAITSSEE